MTTQSDSWQENKSVLERNRYILENEIAADVLFTFDAAEGSPTVLRAHKLVLLSASPVFEAMFCGSMAESRPDCGSIKIEDIDVTIFQEMLRFDVD